MTAHSLQASSGILFGVGVGPGDPELLTMKAYRLLQTVDVICYLIGPRGSSQAKDIAHLALEARTKPVIEIAIEMPMSTERTLANKAYDEGSKNIRKYLDAGKDVVFLCEGDPLFFGSFSYLLDRLRDTHTCQVVPGISSVNASASALVQALTVLQESFVVVSGRHSDQQIEQALREHDTVVIMKAGQARPRILTLLARTGRLNHANYLENIGRDNQYTETDVSTLAHEAGPYFSLFVVLPDQRDIR